MESKAKNRIFGIALPGQEECSIFIMDIEKGSLSVRPIGIKESET